MQLRPIARPSYQGYDVVNLDDDGEYDPVAERAAEERREAQREYRSQRAISIVQAGGKPRSGTFAYSAVQDELAD
jgi:hypothetical protein